MKKLLQTFGAIICVNLLVFCTNDANAQLATGDPQCNEVVASGCVGACGPSSSVSYTVPAGTSWLTLTPTSNSLCPTDGAKARIQVNGHPRGKIDLSKHGGKRFHVNAGDQVVVTVELYPTGSDVVCVWLGEMHYSLCR